MTVGKIAELASIAAIMAGCFLWVGATANDVEATKEDVKQVKEEIKATPTDVAVLQTQVSSLQTAVGEVKAEQSRQDEKLDKILEEVRRR